MREDQKQCKEQPCITFKNNNKKSILKSRRTLKEVRLSKEEHMKAAIVSFFFHSQHLKFATFYAHSMRIDTYVWHAHIHTILP